MPLFLGVACRVRVVLSVLDFLFLLRGSVLLFFASEVVMETPT